MNVMLIGGGGREHAIAMKVIGNPRVERLYALPGNGGIAQLDKCQCVPIKATDIDGIVRFARESRIDFAIVAPDDPLVLGVSDALRAIGVGCFGPSKAAAAIEGSKVFSKTLMEQYGIPTARCRVFSDPHEARAYVKAGPFPAVIKADGLALGKGVIIAEDAATAEAAIASLMETRVFGESGSRVVVEEFLTGPEVSLLALTDGHTLVPLVSALDHKRAHDGDTGLNTGGMGSLSPNPYYTDAIAGECMERIFLPTMRAMRAEGRPFKGCLYFGLMLTADGPKVIEYNCRFGDPEAQSVLALLKSDLFELMLAVEQERLADMAVEFHPGSACCVVMASGGYPESYQTGYPISFGEVAKLPGVTVAHAGTRLSDGRLVTAGGRVLGVIGTAPSHREAISKAYEAVGMIRFEQEFHRTDIGQKALGRA